ncbi:hypothetical protein RN001_008043 [Aquatica leii]|uniref:Uncharacterized protein n=1 Tax=Aquatica leii TaxID=1421715 RepID=A0AAN7P979_9COLE|nr:hypothetical protein RN001_008043 [Aquatica leii]
MFCIFLRRSVVSLSPIRNTRSLHTIYSGIYKKMSDNVAATTSAITGVDNKPEPSEVKNFVSVSVQCGNALTVDEENIVVLQRTCSPVPSAEDELVPDNDGDKMDCNEIDADNKN